MEVSEERETFGPIGDNPLLKHIDGGGGGVPEGSDIGTIVQPKFDVHQILFRHFELTSSSSCSLLLWLPNPYPNPNPSFLDS